jgi:anti-sigma B factor antagonist
MSDFRAFVHPVRRDRPLRVDDDGPRAVVWLEGEHDLATKPDVARAIDSTLQSGRGDVVIDLSGVTFMNASILGVIVQARQALQRCGRGLTLRDPSSRARRVIELGGLSELLDACLELTGLPAAVA